MIRIRVPGDLRYRDLVVRAVAAACKLVRGDSRPPTPLTTGNERLKLSDDFTGQVVSAFSEVFNNIVLHSYAGNKPGDIDIGIETGDDFIEICFSDTGRPFDLDKVPKPDLDSMPEGGLGVFIIQSLMDDFRYEPGPPNRWILKKFAALDSVKKGAVGAE